MENTTKQQIKEYKVGCLFAAIGGFAKAFEDVGATIAWANEKDNYATKTFTTNFPKVKHYHKPIEELSVLGDQLEPVDIITAGFPCQPFSIAGEKRGFEDDRGMLFLEIIRLIQEFGSAKPKVLVMENVKNLRAHDKGRTFQRIQAEIQKAGYWFTENNAKVLNTATHTTIPQNRERIFMVALSTDHFQSNNFIFPSELPDGSMQPVKDFLDLKYKALNKFYIDKSSQYHPLFAEAIDQGGKDAVYQLRRNYVRQNKSGMCFTLMANMGEGGHNQPVIKDRWGIRKLTPRECARLQGYEDAWFSFPSDVPQGQLYKQIGNSVTIPLVRKLAQNVLQELENIGK